MAALRRRRVLQIDVFTGRRKQLQSHPESLVGSAAECWCQNVVDQSKRCLGGHKDRNSPVPEMQLGSDCAETIPKKGSGPLRLTLHAELHRKSHSKPAPLAAQRQPPVRITFLYSSRRGFESDSSRPNVKETVARAEDAKCYD